MNRNKTKILIIAVLATIIAGGAILNSCKKDESLTTKTENVSAVKEQKFLYGYFGESIVLSNTSIGGMSTVTPCISKTTKQEFYNYDKGGRITGCRIEIRHYNCYGVFLWGTEYFITYSNSILSGTLGDLDDVDVLDVNNFDFYVNDDFVTADFFYQKPFEYKEEDGKIQYGKIEITREDVVGLWQVVSPLIDWNKKP